MANRNGTKRHPVVRTSFAEEYCRCAQGDPAPTRKLCSQQLMGRHLEAMPHRGRVSQRRRGGDGRGRRRGRRMRPCSRGASWRRQRRPSSGGGSGGGGGGRHDLRGGGKHARARVKTWAKISHIVDRDAAGAARARGLPSLPRPRTPPLRLYGRRKRVAHPCR
jgi:hypothetical protein